MDKERGSMTGEGVWQGDGIYVRKGAIDEERGFNLRQWAFYVVE